MAKEKLHPMQEVVDDGTGVHRFRENKIVRYLLDHGGIDLNDLAIKDFSDADRMQFAQLIGYSISGYGDLSYVSKKSLKKADKRSDKLFQQEEQ